MTFLLDLTVVDSGFCYLMFVLKTEPTALSVPHKHPTLSYLPHCYLIFDGDKAKLTLEAGSIR